MLMDSVALMKLRTFSVKLTSLSSSYKQVHKYPLSQWKAVLKFMKRKILLDKLEKEFLKISKPVKFEIGLVNLKTKSKSKNNLFEKQKISLIVTR